jgi:hypothetical protein
VSVVYELGPNERVVEVEDIPLPEPEHPSRGWWSMSTRFSCSTTYPSAIAPSARGNRNSKVRLLADGGKPVRQRQMTRGRVGMGSTRQ